MYSQAWSEDALAAAARGEDIWSLPGSASGADARGEKRRRSDESHVHPRTLGDTAVGADGARIANAGEVGSGCADDGRLLRALLSDAWSALSSFDAARCHGAFALPVCGV